MGDMDASLGCLGVGSPLLGREKEDGIGANLDASILFMINQLWDLADLIWNM